MMAVRIAVFCGPAHAGPCAKQARSKRLQKFENQEQDDTDYAYSQGHHFDGSVDRVLHGAVGVYECIVTRELRI